MNYNKHLGDKGTCSVVKLSLLHKTVSDTNLFNNVIYYGVPALLKETEASGTLAMPRDDDVFGSHIPELLLIVCGL